MKALVIGGNRFFGKRLVSLLLKKGAKVTLMNRGLLDDGFGNQVSRIHLDRRTLQKDYPAPANEQWDIIYDQVCYDASEAHGACEAFSGKTQKFVFTSTSSVYKDGENRNESAFDSKKYAFDIPINQEKDYGEAKRQAEATFSKEASFPLSVVRFPFVLGEDDYTGRLKFHVDHVLQNKPIYFPDIDAKVSMIFAADAATFLESLSERELIGPINCCAEDPISLRQMMELIENITRKKMRVASEPTGGDHSPYGVSASGTLNIDRVKSLGFNPSPILQWLPDLIQKLATI